MTYQIFAFYYFHSIEASKIPALQEQMTQAAGQCGIQGLMILGCEGVNATLSGSTESLRSYLDQLCRALQVDHIPVKESTAERPPFKRFKCKIRPEIVTTHDSSLDPSLAPDSHLSPEEWQRTLEQEDVILLDTRNWYETKVGKFQGAIDPGLSQFHEFAKYLPESGIDKNKKVLIYCTGGIRCEKAIVEMNRQGFQNVYQLEGGILKYLEHYPHQKFEGECFVFDHRVAVTQNLKPSTRYSLCPHCGQPGEIAIECLQCGESAVICESCQPQRERQTCSKNCAHHLRLGHRSRLKERKTIKA